MREPIGQILSDLLRDHGALGRLRVFREDPRKVRRAIGKGGIDYVDLSRWTFADSFLAFLVGITDFLAFAAKSYPTPRKRHHVPIWLELCCGIHMALQEEPAFQNLDHLLQAGPILTRVKFNLGGCEGGFNRRNRYPRKTVVCPDTIRKYFRATDPAKLLGWFHGPILGWFRRKRAFAKGRVFALDSTYIEVPENENYEHTSRMALDEHGHPVGSREIAADPKKWRRWANCYKLTYLLHLAEEPAAGGDPRRWYSIPAFRLGPGTTDSHEHGRSILDQVTEEGGKGWVRRLLMDRGFLDGQWIGELKRKGGTDVVIPLRKDMDLYEDVVGLARLRESDADWETVEEERDGRGEVIRKEEVTGFSEVRSWTQCPVPLYVALIRKRWRTAEGESKEDHWAITSTEVFPSARALMECYHLRTRIEEVNRQLKQPRRLDRFTSPEWSLVVAHVLFTLLTYSLIEFYLKSREDFGMTRSFLRTLQREEGLGTHAVVAYAGDAFATFDQEEYSRILLHLSRPAQKEMLERMDRRQEEREGRRKEEERPQDPAKGE